MGKMNALYVLEPNKIEIKEIAIPEPGPADVLIKVMASGICGTDIHILKGEYIGDYPVIPGHEFSGIVKKTGSQVKRIKVGDHVAVEPNIACDNCSFCLENQQNYCENWAATGVTLPGGMEQYVCVPEKAVFNIDGLSFEEGAFVEPLSCVLHGVQELNISIADKVLIIGSGPIGMLLLQTLKLKGVSHITVVDVDRERLEIASQLGADQVYLSLDSVPKDHFEIVVDATGVPALMSQTINFAKKGAEILLFGVPPKKNVEFYAFDIFLKGLKLMSSYTSVRNSQQALSMLASGKINIKPLISHKLPLKDFSKAIDMIGSKSEKTLKVLIMPNE